MHHLMYVQYQELMSMHCIVAAKLENKKKSVNLCMYA